MTALSSDLPLLRAPFTHRLGVAMALHDGPRTTALIAAIEAAADEAGCTVTLADTENVVATETRVVRSLRASGMDGLLLTPSAGDDAVISGLVRLGVPTVLVDRTASRNDVDQVSTECIQAMCALVRHLADHGHQRIGLVAGAPGSATNDERTLGYRLGLGRAGLAWNPDLVACGDPGAAEATARLLDQAAATALVVADETLLIGTHFELHRRGLRPGADVALAGYGAPDWARSVDPPVTTMAQPLAEIGTRAVHTLLTRLAEPDRRPEAVRLPPRLVRGASCGCQIRHR
ncbi:substrate-binding domain-containing protein [Amycolatopsis suaedae]|uniref:LacI family transcriptional regulator n=1 Tax=Amycolatopsis suaedae TaxID=2510978 RepID=A0A4Q7JDU9_9PSEU|nr:substrate-binding domain-containing protein [Amycolatopsis suaedae]RZQ65206.1 LacI family transcriptional regulator [Amycolatopsis suaedae]